MARKPKDEEEHDEELHWTEQPMRLMADQMNAIDIVSQIIDATFVEKGGEHLYNKYLQPKIMPYVSAQTLELAKCQVHVSTS